MTSCCLLAATFKGMFVKWGRTVLTFTRFYSAMCDIDSPFAKAVVTLSSAVVIL